MCAMDIINFFILVYCCIKQGNLFRFWIRNSFTSMDSKSGNYANGEQKGRLFGEFSNDEEDQVRLKQK